ncbi:unnamed protein product [Polarella glacialis]|uniref:Uncharacterized protein n=1 Tax=Polarella glacialis TaxID=89957 RepID=A0A813G2C7_POLGL|nr:unnamed protein product [Polarella glacialis]
MVAEATAISSILLPVWAAYILASLRNAYYCCMFLLCSFVGVSFAMTMDVDDIAAMRMGWQNICFSTRKVREALGYGHSLRDYVSKEKCLRQTVAWGQDFWLNLQSEAVRNNNNKNKNHNTFLNNNHNNKNNKPQQQQEQQEQQEHFSRRDTGFEELAPKWSHGVKRGHLVVVSGRIQL